MMNRVNILILNKFREVGGSEVFLLELMEHLPRDRFRPVVVPIGETSVKARDLLIQQRVTIYEDLFKSTAASDPLDDNRALGRLLSNLISPQGRRSPYDLGAVFRLARILRRESIDILLYLDKHAALNLAPLAALIARTPFMVGSFHTPGLEFSVIEKLLSATNDRVVATSNFHRRYLIEQLGLPEEKIRVVHNGISVDRFKASRDGKASRVDFNIPPGAPVAGVVARLVEQKNLSLFLHAAVLVLERVPQAHFLLVGDGPLRQDLERQAAELGLSERVHFLGYREDIGDLLGFFDISVLSSRDEWFPYSLLESMLVGLPVVSTDVGAVSELVVKGETGLLTPPGDGHALAAAMAVLLTNREQARQMGAAGRRRVERVFSSRQMAARFEALFTELLSAKGSSLVEGYGS